MKIINGGFSGGKYWLMFLPNWTCDSFVTVWFDDAFSALEYLGSIP